MKAHIHPLYRTVVFHDTSANEYFKVGSTIRTDRVIELDGETFPYVALNSATRIASWLNAKGGCTLSVRATPASKRCRGAKNAVNGNSPASGAVGRRR